MKEGDFYIGRIKKKKEKSFLQFIHVLPRIFGEIEMVCTKEKATCYDSFEKARSAINNIGLTYGEWGVWTYKDNYGRVK